jgi:hypothetical protein
VANVTLHAPAGEISYSVPYHKQSEVWRSAYSPKLRAQAECGYLALVNDPQYAHFVRIPERILRCLDYFGVACKREETRARLLSYYLFIAVVDSAIDSGHIDTGERILAQLSAQTSLPDEEIESVRLITSILKSHISEDSYSSMMSGFRELYQQVVSERAATSIDAYVEHRKAVGRLTAELSYLLIRPLLATDNESLCRFMTQVGEVGCLVDSLIDLNADHRLGLLMFKPTIMDRVKLVVCTLQKGLSVWLRHPGLSGVFLQAVCDNVRDRFVRSRRPDAHYPVSDRKGAAASVA